MKTVYHIVILGGSFAGFNADICPQAQPNEKMEITVASRTDRFWFMPSLIWVPVGMTGSARRNGK